MSDSTADDRDDGDDLLNQMIRLPLRVVDRIVDRVSGGDIGGDETEIQANSPSTAAVDASKSTINPWDRDPNESDQAWVAFRYYRDIGPEVRGYGMAARDLGHNESTTSRWCTKHRWQDRAAAWDAHLDRIAQRAFEAEAMSMGKRHAHIGMKLQTLGSERIVEYAERAELKGTITVREALEITKTGVAIEREARAMDKSSTQQGSGNIIFNFNMGGKAPKWAPKTISGGEAHMNKLEDDGGQSE